MSSSVGMIIPNIWKAKFMFQTTNQTSYQPSHIDPCLIEVLQQLPQSTQLHLAALLGGRSGERQQNHGDLLGWNNENCDIYEI